MCMLTLKSSFHYLNLYLDHCVNNLLNFNSCNSSFIYGIVFKYSLCPLSKITPMSFFTLNELNRTKVIRPWR